jgi:hypothetical protein
VTTNGVRSLPMNKPHGSCICDGISYLSNAALPRRRFATARIVRNKATRRDSIYVAAPQADLRIEGQTLKTFDNFGDLFLPVQRLPAASTCWEILPC